MKWENSTVQLINGLVKAAGMHCMLIMILWLLKKNNRPMKDLLLYYFFLLEYLIDVLDKNTLQKNLPSITITEPIRKSLRPAP